MFLLGILDFNYIYPLAFIAVIIEPFLAIRLGIYAGFKIKKRWFLPIIECIVFFLLFKIVEYIAFCVLIDPTEKWWLYMYEILYIPEYEIIVLCFWMSLSLLAMFITVLMRGKKTNWIRILISIVLIVFVISSWGIGLNKKYCPTYYKYPDYIIKEVLERRDCIESVFGEFDFFERGYAAYGGYYAYTDEQGNDWYYTIHFLEGDVQDIRMEIH
ncbi:MAG: hypothetical protein ACI4DW_00285 [Lachnospiraceae bacterium]